MIQCNIRSLTNKKYQIHLTSLFDTDATGIAFVDVAMTCHVCEVLQIFFILLAKLKLVRGFNGQPATDITHVIYSTLTMQGHFELLVPMLVTKFGQHPLILDKPWMRKHGVIIDMSCDKITFWPGHYQHSTVKTELQEITLVPSQSKPMRGQEEVLVRESGRIVLPSSPKENSKKVSTVQNIFYTNFDVTKPKKGVTSGMKILEKESNAKTKQKKTVLTKNLSKLLPHVLPNAQGYRYVSKEAEELPAKYIVPQRQAKASSAVPLLTLSKAS